MEVAEAMVKYIIRTVMDRCPDEMQFFNKFIDKGLLDRLHNVVDNDFGRVSYTEAVDILQKSGVEFEYPVEWGTDRRREDRGRGGPAGPRRGRDRGRQPA